MIPCLQPWRLSLLGGLTAYQPDREVLRFQRRKTGTLLGYLALYQDISHSRDTLVDLIWPDQDVDKGRASLSTSLNALRRQLEPPDMGYESVLVATRMDVRLNGRAVTTDVNEFQAAAENAFLQADSQGMHDELLRAFNLYRGELLPGCLDEWVSVDRDRLTTSYIRVVRNLVNLLDERGLAEQALDIAMHAVAVARDREEAHFEVLRLQRKLGRDVAAAAHYQKLIQMLDEEWGLRPSEGTRKLMEGVRPFAKGQRIPNRRSVRTPARIVTIPAEASRTTTADAPPKVNDASAPAPLPLYLTRFFGREQEIDTVIRMLFPLDATVDPERCITLTGVGGTGKTRLAREILTRILPELEGQVAFASLAPVSDSAGVLRAVLDSSGKAAADESKIEDQICAAFADKRWVLCLDNAEHVPSHVVNLVQTLLGRLPLLSLVITSRTPLEMPGERVFPISALQTPLKDGTPERLAEFPSVRMFVDRAQAVSPSFQVTNRNSAAVAALCVRLEGLPLAIELAAARTSTLTPAQMLDELENRFDFLISRQRGETRHKTLHTAIAWSFELLDSAERQFFTSMCVFRGGWTLSAARAVATVPPGKNALQLLESLVTYSLVRADDDSNTQEKRYTLLETLREFAILQVGDSDRSGLQDRHVEFYLSMVDTQWEMLRGPESESASHTLDTEHDNVRAALKYSMGTPSAVHIATRLWNYWFTRGHAMEGSDWLRRSLETYRAEAALNSDSSFQQLDPRLEVRALNGLAVLEKYTGRLESARARLAEAADLARSTNDEYGLGIVLNSQAIIADEYDEPEIAARLTEEALTLHRKLGNDYGIASMLNNLGRLAERRCDLERACQYYRESVHLFEELGDKEKVAAVLINMGVVAIEMKDYPFAQAAYTKSLEINRSLGSTRSVGIILYNIGELLLLQSNHTTALEYLRESLRIRMELQDTTEVPRVIAAVAQASYQEGDLEKSARLSGAAAQLLKRTKRTLSPTAQVEFDSFNQDLQRRMRPGEYDAARAYGSLMSLKDTVHLALNGPTLVLTNRYNSDFQDVQSLPKSLD